MFNPNEHLMQLQGKDYLPVQWRLVWFRDLCPEGSIETEEIMVDLDREVEEETYVWNAEKRRKEKVLKTSRGYARFRAIVTDGKGGRATGTKSENAASFPDYIEKAETGAIGRALAALGYGTQFAPEMDEAHRIVDSPVERPSSERKPVAGDPPPGKLISREKLNDLFARGKKAGCFANLDEFAVYIKDELDLDVVMEPRLLTEEQGRDLEAVIFNRERHSA